MRFPDLLRSEHGFTLIELLVGMISALLVTFAAFALLQVASEQSSRASDYVQADQRARVAMARLTDELSSACLSYEFTPVQSESNSEKLVFIDGFSKEAEIPVGQVQRHELVWKKKEKIGAKTLPPRIEDIKQVATAKSGTTYTFSATKSPTVLEYINKPTFQYYKYNTEASSTSETGVSALKLISYTTELKEAAKEVAGVTINFRAVPNDEKESLGRTLELTNQVTFSFSNPIAEPTISDKPCE